MLRFTQTYTMTPKRFWESALPIPLFDLFVEGKRIIMGIPLLEAEELTQIWGVKTEIKNAC